MTKFFKIGFRVISTIVLVIPIGTAVGCGVSGVGVSTNRRVTENPRGKHATSTPGGYVRNLDAGAIEVSEVDNSHLNIKMPVRHLSKPINGLDSVDELFLKDGKRLPILDGIETFPTLKQQDFYPYIDIVKYLPHITDKMIAKVVKNVISSMNISSGSVYWGYKRIDDFYAYVQFIWVDGSHSSIKTYKIQLFRYND